MSEVEIDYCDICHKKKQVQRKYYYYNINCECCGGPQHFEIVKYCAECEPVPPRRIAAIVVPVPREKRKSSHSENEGCHE